MSSPKVIRDIEDRLKLSGGNLTGSFLGLYDGYGKVQSDTGLTMILSRNIANDDNNYRSLRVFNSSYADNVSNSLRFMNKKDGAITEYKIYGEHNKPTATDVGALSLNGGTLTGSRISLLNGKGYISASNTLDIGIFDTENDANNRRILSIYDINTKVNLKDSLLYVSIVDGKMSTYTIYGTHNKPTPSEIGAAAESHNHTSLSDVTKINFKAESSDYASIETLIDGTNTYFDFHLRDDVGQNDMWRWRFNPSGGEGIFNAMTLDVTSIHEARLTTQNIYAHFYRIIDSSGTDVGTIFRNVDGTTSAMGSTYCILGNNIAQGSSGNSKGFLRLCNNGTRYTDISFTANATANRSITIPDLNGTMSVANIFDGTGSGGTGTNGYVNFADIEIYGAYSNRPIEFELTCRGKATSCKVSLCFLNSNGTDPGIHSFTYQGTNYGIFIQKIGSGLWRLWHSKTEGYDNVTVIRCLEPGQNIKITYPNGFATTKPTTDVIDCVLGGNIGNANTLDGYHMSSGTGSMPSSAENNTVYIKY